MSSGTNGKPYIFFQYINQIEKNKKSGGKKILRDTQSNDCQHWQYLDTSFFFPPLFLNVSCLKKKALNIHHI
jgi:hypothetical protein